MKIFRYNDCKQPRYGIKTEDGIYKMQGSPFSQKFITDRLISDHYLNTTLTPTTPTKIFGVSENFGSLENKLKISDQIFTKTVNSAIGCNDYIIIPSDSDDLIFEGELVVVIGREAKNISIEDATKYILG